MNAIKMLGPARGCNLSIKFLVMLLLFMHFREIYWKF